MIYKEIPDQDPVLLEPDKITVELEDGTQLTAAMLLDKDGNETHITFDAVKVLARHEGEWYEVSIKEGSWESFPLH